MKSPRTLAAAYFTLTWGVICFSLLFIEPGMGFETTSDFFDPVKVAAGYESLFSWRLTNIFFLGLPIAIAALIANSDDRYLRWSGMFSALLVLIFCCIDLVGFQLPNFLPTDKAVFDALASLLPIRFAIQKAMVVMLGIFIWRMTRIRTNHESVSLFWTGTGWVVLGLSILFLFVIVPMPLVFFLWALGLTIREISRERRSAD